ncbi:AsnC family transcriptional regulator [Candidatus Woesearchaeota archaeon]|nr:AsnC family transcriptional regulator [Candidatus Woesearchaeota archaeon]
MVVEKPGLMENLEPLDEKDKVILRALQRDGRVSLTNLAKKLNVAIDTVKARIERMQEKNVMHVGAFINPKAVGYPLVADVKIKLHNNSQEDTVAFIAHLKSHPRVIDLLSLMGDYDLTCVIIAKNTSELEQISQDIRQKFKTIIADWRGFLVLRMHKFEEYALE